MRFFLFLPLLMLGVIACGFYVMWSQGAFDPLLSSSPRFVAFVHQVPIPSPAPQVAGARSVQKPLVNPVLHIYVPAKSIFAPE